MLDALGVPAARHGNQPGQRAGSSFEVGVQKLLSQQLPIRVPETPWNVRRNPKISSYTQYSHLAGVDRAIARDANLRVALGTDYVIAPDVVVGRMDSPEPSAEPWMHAVVSCKWTIRSDRVQNVRHEFSHLVKNRRGRLPHLLVVTAEPLPSRLAAIARGTGEVDATYHIAFEALALAVTASRNTRQKDVWDEIVGQGRIRSLKQLPGDVAHW